MRFVLIGSNALTLATARMLLDEGFEVVLIERDMERIDVLSEQLACGFLHGDGGAPDVLEQADPHNTDALFSLLDNEQTNIIVALVARSLKFRRVIPLVTEDVFERIATELGLEDTVAPNRAVARHLANLMKGEQSLEMSSLIHADARVYSFIVTDSQAGPLEEFALPKGVGFICIYRDSKLVLPDETDRLEQDDEVVLISRSDRLPELKKRYGHPPNGNGG
ncbi:potassium channel family protein [Saccharospirillum salsuginis]|uniref:Potassium transporter n=1 Tax=Saccharospirillum salsuginis TaxID=418750 RepID=A0A918N5X6_9GAMM|nr:TrkA family potassium uptake protein [Saccharospirillum salsuginis]GGX40587.1 potassium transporter [Saccharospirillum salsuginis]